MAAGSVVTKSFDEENIIIGGNPEEKLVLGKSIKKNMKIKP